MTDEPNLRYQLVRDLWWGCLDCGVPVWDRDIHDEFHETLDAIMKNASNGSRAMSLLTPLA